MKSCRISESLTVGGDAPTRLLLIAGPCQIESRGHTLKIAEFLQSMTRSYPVDLVFKSSFDKANRTSLEGRRGIGLEEGLTILQEVRETFELPVITDIHTAEQAQVVGEVVDIIQTPAFLCRQTDLLIAAGATGRPVMIKKGQFLHPEDMKYSAEKVVSGGSNNVLLCERGTTFGYRDLVVDPRSLLIMRGLGRPVMFDATHSVQSMGGAKGKSGGSRRFVAPLSRAAVALGVDGLFIECHDNPDAAPSDGPSMVPLEELDPLLSSVSRLWEVMMEVKAQEAAKISS